eukprot:2695079-Pyramimonas_sp.AAC.1
MPRPTAASRAFGGVPRRAANCVRVLQVHGAAAASGAVGGGPHGATTRASGAHVRARPLTLGPLAGLFFFGPSNARRACRCRVRLMPLGPSTEPGEC